jgi:uncharacterized protein (DUF433 family)
MEGNSLMEQLRKYVFQQLRSGVSITEILDNFNKVGLELLTMKDYAKAIEEADRAP